MTPEQLKKVHIALEQTSGKITPAAALLGLTPGALKTLIKQHPELASYSKDAQPPTDAETMARPALPVTREELSVVEAVEQGDRQVREGFEAIGVHGGALEQAMAFRDFGKLHFQSMRHYISGGVAKLFADLMADIKAVRDEIEDPMVKPDLDMQKMLREDRSRLVKMALETYDRTRQAALDAAVIEAKRKEAKEGKKGKVIPAFAPLAMKVEGNVTVNELKPPAPESVKGPVPEGAVG